jgi:hypothetical protein
MSMLDNLQSSPNFYSEIFPDTLCRDRLERAANVLFRHHYTRQILASQQTRQDLHEVSDDDFERTIFELSDPRRRTKEISSELHPPSNDATRDRSTGLLRRFDSREQTLVNDGSSTHTSRLSQSSLAGMSPRPTQNVQSSAPSQTTSMFSLSKRGTCSSKLDELDDLDIDDLDERPFKRAAVGLNAISRAVGRQGTVLSSCREGPPPLIGQTRSKQADVISRYMKLLLLKVQDCNM